MNLLRDSNKQPIDSVIPEEGATGWADTTMMHAKAPHPNCAYMWLEHSLQPKLQGDLAAWFGTVPVVPAACTGNALLGDSGCKTNGADNFDKISFWHTPVADCGGGQDLRALQGLGQRLSGDPERAVAGSAGRAVIGPPGARLFVMADPSPSAVSFRHVSRHFGEVRAVDDVSFDIADGEFFSMLGPSGSGKTTCLRLIAGFEQPSAGEVVIHGRNDGGRPAL